MTNLSIAYRWLLHRKSPRRQRPTLPLYNILFSSILLILSTNTVDAGWNYKSKLIIADRHYDVLEDRQGYIWFSTGVGVNRFDGYNYMKLRKQDGLLNDNVFSMHEDYKGRIWFLTGDKGLCYFENDTIVSYAGNRVLSRIITGYPSDLYIGLNDTVWIVNRQQSHFYKCWNDTAVEVYWQNPHSQDSAVIYIKKIDDHGRLILRSGVPDVSVQTASLTYNNGDFRICFPQGKSSGRSETNLLILQNNKKFLQIDRSLILFDSTGILACNEQATKHHIMWFYADQNNDIWAGTSSGAYRFKNANILDPSPEILFPQGKINRIIQDRVGNYWVSDYNTGIFFLPNLHFQSYRTTQTAQPEQPNWFNSVPTNNVVSLHVYNNNIWFASKDGSIYRFDSTLLCHTVINGSSDLKGDAETLDFLVDHRQNVWTGNTLHIVNPTTKSTQLHAVGSVKALLQLSDNRVIVGRSGGFNIFQNYVPTLSSSMLDFRQLTIALYEDTDRSIWLGTSSGLYNYKNSTIQNYGEKHPALQQGINDITRDGEGFLFVGTDSGIVIMNNDSVYYHITIKDGLIDDYTQSLVVESDTTIWAAGGGLNRIVIQNWKPFSCQITSYSSLHGLPSDGIWNMALYDNHLWLATFNGLCRFNPKEPSSDILAPIHITGISINDNSVHLQTDYDLTHNENDIMISYVGICFRTLGEVEHRYRLLGDRNDTLWVNTTALDITFASLPPGDYLFQVTAANENGTWNPIPAEVRFHISSHFTDTIWFQICLVLLGLSIAGITAWRFIQNQKERHLIDAQITELRQKMLGANMNPHFVFNSLSSIQDYINQHDLYEANKFLAQFSKLIRMNMNASQKSFASLEEELDRLQLYLSLEKLRFGDRMDYQVSIDKNIDPDETMIPTMLLQPYVENAIWHGILPLKHPGQVEVEVSKASALSYTVEIRDNGVGFSQGADMKKSKHTSLSMKLNKERLELLSQSTKQSFSIKVNDRVDTTGKICGTIVRIVLPLEISIE